MKITADIGGRLLKKALKASRTKTQREVLEKGLRTLLSGIERGTFVREFDPLRLRLSLEELAQGRR